MSPIRLLTLVIGFIVSLTFQPAITVARETAIAIPPRLEEETRVRLKISDDGERLLLWSLKSLWVIDVKTNATIWNSSAYDYDDVSFVDLKGTKVLAVLHRRGSILVVDLTSGTSTLHPTKEHFGYAASNELGTLAVLAQRYSGKFSIVDGAFREINSTYIQPLETEILSLSSPIWITGTNDFIVGSIKGTLARIDARTGELKQRTKVDGVLDDLRKTEDGMLVAITQNDNQQKESNKDIIVIDPETGQTIRRVKTSFKHIVDVEATRNTVWFSAQGDIYAADFDKSTPVKLIRGANFIKLKNRDRLLVVDEEKWGIASYTTLGRDRKPFLSMTRQVGAAAFSDDGSKAIVSSLGKQGIQFDFIDTKTGVSTRTVNSGVGSNRADPASMFTSRNGELSVLWLEKIEALQIHRAGRPVSSLKLPGRLALAIAVDQDNKRMTVSTVETAGYAETMKIFNADMSFLQNANPKVLINKLQKQNSKSDPRVEIYDLSGTNPKLLRATKLPSLGLAIANSFSGSSIFVATFDGYLYRLNTNGELKRTLIETKGSSTQVEISPRGDIGALVSSDGGLSVFEAETGREIFRQSLADINWIKWSPDGRTLLVSQEAGLRFISTQFTSKLDLQNRRLLALSDSGKTALVKNVHGEYQLTSRTRDNVFDKTQKLDDVVATTRRLSTVVTDMLAAGIDGSRTLKVWSATTGKVLWKYDIRSPGSAARIHVRESANRLILIDAGRAISFDLQKGTEIGSFEWVKDDDLDARVSVNSAATELTYHYADKIIARKIPNGEISLSLLVQNGESAVFESDDSIIYSKSGRYFKRVARNGEEEILSTPPMSGKTQLVPYGKFIAAQLALRDGSRLIQCFDPSSGNPLQELAGNEGSAFISSTTGTLLAFENNGAVDFISCQALGQDRSRIPISSPSAAAFITASRVAVSYRDGGIGVWDRSSQRIEGEMFPTLSGGWLAIARNGQAQLNNLDDLNDVKVWIGNRAKEPARDLALMRDVLLSPNLLGHIFHGGNPFAELRTLGPDVLNEGGIVFSSIRSSINEPGSVDIEIGFESTKTPADFLEIRLYRAGKFVGSTVEGTAPYTGLIGGDGHITFKNVKHNLGERGTFSISAMNGSGVWSYAVTAANVIEATKISAPPPKLHILAVGIDRAAKGFPILKFAGNDASQFVKTAIAVLRLEPNEVRSKLLVSSEIEFGASEVVGAIEKLGVRHIDRPSNGNSAEPQDTVVIYLSGHGTLTKSGEYAFVIPSTSNLGEPQFITASELGRAIARIDANKIYLLLDTCYSGAALDTGYKQASRLGADLGRIAFDKRITVLAASESSESAWEYGGLQHGLLTYGLLRAAEQDAGRGSSNLSQWLRSGVEILRTDFPFSQRPIFSDFASGN